MSKRTVEVVRVDEVQGWPLAVTRGDDGGEVPTIEDVELGRRLGFERPHDIRRLIVRHENSLGALSRYRGEKPTGEKGRPREGYLLTEEQACFIAAKSETPKANELLRGMIAVFLAWRRGMLAPTGGSGLAPTMAQIVAMMTQIVRQEVKLVLEAAKDRLESDCGIIGKTKAMRFIKHELLDLAKRSVPPLPALPTPEATLRAGREYVRSYMRARTRLDNELRGRIGYSGSGRAWANLPERDLPDVKLVLAEMRGRVEADAKTRAAKQAQVEMFGEKLGARPN